MATGSQSSTGARSLRDAMNGWTHMQKFVDALGKYCEEERKLAVCEAELAKLGEETQRLGASEDRLNVEMSKVNQIGRVLIHNEKDIPYARQLREGGYTGTFMVHEKGQRDIPDLLRENGIPFEMIQHQ